MLLLRPDPSLWLTIVCVIATPVGALVGWGIGHLAWSALGQALLEMYGQANNFQRYQRLGYGSSLPRASHRYLSNSSRLRPASPR
jgi:membrane protein YqaA with SNARE-associated domain